MGVYSRHRADRFTVYCGGVPYDGARGSYWAFRNKRPERQGTFACVHNRAWLLFKRSEGTNRTP